METVNLKDIPKKFRILLLKELGYDIDADEFVVDSHGKRVFDHYSNTFVRMNNMAILPGHGAEPVIIDENPLSIAAYMRDYPEIDL
jgi:hypothetical protein